jgi:hypothetical protein
LETELIAPSGFRRFVFQPCKHGRRHISHKVYSRAAP